MRKLYIVLGLLIVFGFAAALWFYFTEKEVEGILEASGQVRGTEVTISSKLPGTVKELLIQEGQTIKEGDLIAKLSSQEIEAKVEQARSQVEAARNGLKEIEAGVRKLKTQIEEAQANVKFAKEESFHQIHRAEAALERAEADIRDAQSQRDLAQTDYEKFLQLYKEGVISKKRFEEIEARSKSAEARLEVAKRAKEEERAQLQASQATVFQVEGKEKGFQSLQNELERMRASQDVAKNQIDVAIAKTKEVEATLRDTEIYAPSGGAVINKLVEEGELVAAGTPIAVLVDLSNIYVRVYISERDIGKVRLGNPARIFADAFPDRYFDGQVTEISQEAEFTPKEVQMKEERTKLVFGLKVRIENPKGYLKPGLPVDVKIRWKQDVPW